MGVIFKNGIPYGGVAGGQCTDYTLDFNAATNELTLSDGSASVQTLGLDADTGWQTLTGDYFDMFYRKKNGVVYVDFNASALKQDIPVGYTTCFNSIPDAIKPPNTNITGPICDAQTYEQVGVYLIMTNGTIVFRMKTAMPATHWIAQHVSYPV